VGNTFNDQQNINLPFPSEYIADGGCAWASSESSWGGFLSEKNFPLLVIPLFFRASTRRSNYKIN
jgi:hypothetical protein